MAVEEIILKITGQSGEGERAIDRVVSRLRQLGVALSAVSAAGAAFIGSAAKTAARTQVLGTAMMVVAKNAEYTEAEITALEERMKDLGITTQQSRLGITRMIQANLDLGKATDLARTAQDLAVIAGKNSSETYEILNTAIATTNPRILRQINLLVSLREVYGENADQLSVAEKRVKLLNYILKEGEKVAGVYETAMGDVGKAVTSLPRLFEEAKNAIGTHFLPIWKKLVDLLSAGLKWFNALPEPVQKFIAYALGLVTAITGLAGPLLLLLGFLPSIVAGFSALVSVLPVLLPILGVVAGAIAGLVGAVVILKKAWDENWGGIRDTVQFVVDTIKPHLDKIAADVRYWIDVIKDQLGKIMAAVRSLVEPALKRLRQLFGEGAGLKDLMRTVQDMVNVILSTVSGLLESIRLLLEGKSEEAMAPLEDAALNVITAIVLVWQKYTSKAVRYGWNLIVNLANGIIRAARSVLRKAANFIGNILSSFLAPGSPPREGPLRGIMKWGKGLIDTFLRGFGLADFGILRDTLAPLRQALEAAVDLGDIAKSDMLGVFKEVRGQVASLIADFRKTGEIGEETLAAISERLGEGGQDYVEYLRLTLEHQKALDRLRQVEEEVAAAQAKGFVPAALQERLDAAKAEAEAKKEAVDWQREYLDALQEGVDIQRELLTAMEELADAVKDLAGEGVGAEAGIGIEEGAVEEEAEKALKGFGGLSEEFEAMKEKVRNFFKELPGKVEAWIEDTKEKLLNKWEEIKEDLKTKLVEILLAILEWLADTRQGIIDKWEEVKEDVSTKWSEIKTAVADKVEEIIDDISTKWEIIKFRAQEKWEEIKSAIADKWDEIKTAVGGKIDELKTSLATWWDEIKTNVSDKWEEIKTTIGDKVTEAKDLVVGKIADFVQAGKDIIAGFLEGLVEKWTEIKKWFTDRLEEMPGFVKKMFGIESPSKVFAELGANMAQGLIEGWKQVSLRPALQANLTSALALRGGLAGINQSLTVVFVDGAFDGAFPGVRDGRDAESVLERIQELVNQGYLRAQVPGGVAA